MKVGFFDSGIGGLTVLKEALSLIDNVDFIYFADVKNVPYGNKTKDEVKSIVFDVVDFLIDNQKCDAIVLACNTATSVAAADLRKKYLTVPIIGMEPAVKPAVNLAKDGKRVLVLATKLTLQEEKFHNLVTNIDKNHIVDSVSAGSLVEFAEKRIFNGEVVENYIKQLLSPFNLNCYDSIVLGCTHFIYFKPIFRKIIPTNLELVDGNIGTINNLKTILNNKIFEKKELTLKIFQSKREVDNQIYKEILCQI